MTKDDIVCRMKQKFNNSSVRLPQDIEIDFSENNRCRLVLRSVNVNSKNMQEDANAFEGWAIALYLSFDKQINVVIDVDMPFDTSSYLTKGHLCRFLYRAMKFSEQYAWFMLSAYLQSEVSKFKKYLTEGKFINNIPLGTAHENHHKECAVEAELSKRDVLKNQLLGQLDVGKGTVYRQLPVGLFENEVAEKNMMFTGTKSAVDLWNIQENDFRVYELKTQNKMVGIVTEIFFYSNYFYDFLVIGDYFKLNRSQIGDRGYSELLNAKINHVIGVMLADTYHPIVNDELTVLLNENSSGIAYYRTVYHIQN